jgi:hypothetical protein
MVSARGAHGVIVDRATVLEWPQIEDLRRAYFAKWNQPVQRRDDSVTWFTARIGEKVLGCYSTCESGGQRWALDFYVVDGRYGKLAAGIMYQALHADADRDETSLVCIVHPRNIAMLEATREHGWDPIGVLFLREPGKGRRYATSRRRRGSRSLGSRIADFWKRSTEGKQRE